MKPSLLELRHLQTLLALVETGTLSKAAARVFLTQSALSHQIKQLEDHYGVALFERKTQPLRLSPAGQRLHGLAETVMKAVREAERDIARIAQGNSGQLRIAVECHTCFDWLMPAMDQFREHWPEIELDLVSGFHADPLALLREDRAELVVVSEPQAHEGIAFHPLFRFEIVGLVSRRHPLAPRDFLAPEDFAEETLLSYPVPEDMLDIVRKVLKPRGIEPRRRTAELTVAILQLVASRRGIAALPQWTVQSYLDREYVLAKPIGETGLWSALYAATTERMAQSVYMGDFLDIVRSSSFRNLRGLLPLTKEDSP
ncbi:transcriptional regulator MetR [Methylococcus capsulatus str. Bath]|uniref:HTH-type transcriptional regulator MetR n=2 Tax=Methylococcus capsulatus TaxID=414 RepID=Q605L9_METCA|nr:LysR family transcriptional regulator [Methylococcus capsulatus]AAU91737.1 transcriptional regulator MetR [Methylococcus capsulatus str. Bath]CAI8842434.1 DNA-binding transcriptional dual regulator MetR [Methylococcus capsulatus]